MFHELVKWIQTVPGAAQGDPTTSWSQQLLGSLNQWSLLEGTHVLVLMLFAGTIMLVDLRLLGVAFKSTPFSRLNDRILPLTIIGFALMIVTGVILFLAKPIHYYHSVWFRAKLIFLVIASLNIFWFHYKVQKNQADWDALESPPAAARLSAAISLTSWTLIIVFGRFIAYNWYDCDKVVPNSFPYAFAECASEMADAAALPASVDKRTPPQLNEPQPAATPTPAQPQNGSSGAAAPGKGG